ncbi:MAG TPA: PEP-CTERM sorting domain-containing protein, partial [Candidatus Synoicihabitans sp.]|nr:PEP-CTERM sorting domain-containing protein [Candidatus Synoicihabitans sp.]
RTISPIDGSVLADALSAWDFNYGDLEHVAFPTTDGYVGEIAFVPAPDHAIHLVSFDLAGWFRVDRPITVLRLLDAAGNILFDFAANGPITIQGDGNGPQHSSFSPDFYHVGVLRLQWGTDWDVGLDNLRFEGVHFTAIPEPSTTALLVLGGVSLVLVHLRSRRTRRH